MGEQQLAFRFDEQTESRFREYHAQNPEVYRMFCVFAGQLLAAGRRHLGAKMIAERIRFESHVRGHDGYKINNTFVAYYARKYERDHPQHTGIFEFRRARADIEGV